eukprot:756166-Hanusia_phi.AAC.1
MAAAIATMEMVVDEREEDDDEVVEVMVVVVVMMMDKKETGTVWIVRADLCRLQSSITASSSSSSSSSSPQLPLARLLCSFLCCQSADCQPCQHASDVALQQGGECVDLQGSEQRQRRNQEE